MEQETSDAIKVFFQELTSFIKWLRVVIDEERKKP
jgi:hypothetical protein